MPPPWRVAVRDELARRASGCPSFEQMFGAHAAGMKVLP
jgi:hypothetical protein